ncbi:MAG: hypothetical protein HZA11_00120 [Nitrospirae bacterium]|nr:hypothetical protein [Nitrospirota bacterium]
MRTKFFSVMALLPLLVVIILAVAGITLNFWVYAILGVVCPTVAGAIWFIYKDTERKVKDAGSGLEKK